MPRKPDVDERLRQVLKVAHLFYEKEMTKTDISHEIRASTTQVARLLAEAREQGYVRIEFNPPKLYELGEQLKAKYDLQAAVVVSYADDPAFLRRMIGKAAAQYFEEAVGRARRSRSAAATRCTRWCWPAARGARQQAGSRRGHRYRSRAHAHRPGGAGDLALGEEGRLPGRAHFATGLPMNKLLSRQKVREEYEEFSHRKAVQEVLAEMKRADFLFTSLGCLKVDPLMKTRAAPSPIHARKPEADRSRPAQRARSATSTILFCRRRDDGA